MKILIKSILIISSLFFISANSMAATSEVVLNDEYERDAEETIEKAKKLKGYEVKFDYQNHPKEREIAYKFYLDKYSKYYPGLTKNDMGIDLYDLDNDGEKEILLYIDAKDKCPRAGCTFSTIKPIYNNDNITAEYRQIMWSSKTGISLGIDGPIKILLSSTNNYHDILTEADNECATIWKWNKNFYKEKFIGNPVGNQIARDLEE